MERLQKQIRLEDEQINCVAFAKHQYLILAHGNKLTITSAKDNFTTRATFPLPGKFYHSPSPGSTTTVRKLCVSGSTVFAGGSDGQVSWCALD